MCTYTFYFSVSSSALLRLSCLIEKEGKKKNQCKVLAFREF